MNFPSNNPKLPWEDSASVAAGPKQVNDFHSNSDVDSSDLATHHTLGYGANQAAPGSDVSRRLSALEEAYIGVGCSQTVGQAIAAATTVLSNWDITNAGGLLSGFPMKGLTHSAGVFTVPETGFYFIRFQVSSPSRASARVYIDILINGTGGTESRIDIANTGVTQSNSFSVEDVYYLTAGNTIAGRYNTGIAFTSVANTTKCTILKVRNA
jgi:hypothetical protein